MKLSLDILEKIEKIEEVCNFEKKFSVCLNDIVENNFSKKII